MSALPVSSSAPNQEWITPEEQLRRLHSPLVGEVFANCVPKISEIIAGYVDGQNKALTNWYTALFRLKALPESLPALPENINDILAAECPIYRDSRKQDGSHYTVGDTHSLYFDPFSSLEALETSVGVYADEKPPLRVSNLFANWKLSTYLMMAGEIRRADGRKVSNGSGWILMTHETLGYKETERIVELSNKGFANYEVPSLKNAVAFMFLDNVATRERLFIYDSIVVQEIAAGYRLAVGPFEEDGLSLNRSKNSDDFAMAFVRRI